MSPCSSASNDSRVCQSRARARDRRRVDFEHHFLSSFTINPPTGSFSLAMSESISSARYRLPRTSRSIIERRAVDAVAFAAGAISSMVSAGGISRSRLRKCRHLSRRRNGYVYSIAVSMTRACATDARRHVLADLIDGHVRLRTRLPFLRFFRRCFFNRRTKLSSGCFGVSLFLC